MCGIFSCDGNQWLLNWSWISRKLRFPKSGQHSATAKCQPSTDPPDAQDTSSTTLRSWTRQHREGVSFIFYPGLFLSRRPFYIWVLLGSEYLTKLHVPLIFFFNYNTVFLFFFLKKKKGKKKTRKVGRKGGRVEREGGIIQRRV